jgi:flavin-dependent dehydrogenase
VTDVEVLIVGAGPAGLLAATYLAKNHRVALVERGLLAKTTKYWATTDRRLQKHQLSECVRHRPRAMVVGTFLGGRLAAEGDLVVVDEHQLLEKLVGRCRERGVLLAERCRLISFAWKGNRVVADTTSGVYHARLLVDASGTNSLVAQTFRLHRREGFMSVLGAHIQNIQLHTPDLVLAYVNSLGTPSPMLEVFPTGNNSAYCAIFMCARSLISPRSLDAAFKAECSRNPFFDLTKNSQFVEGKAGAIAIGQMRTLELPGVFSFGEAGMIQPPLLGSTFNEILEHCEVVCNHLTSVLSQTEGVPARTRYKYPIMKQVQDRIQLSLARTLLDGNVETFDRVVRFMSMLAPGYVYDFCSNELTWRHLASAAFKAPQFLWATRGQLKRRSKA